MYVGGSGEGNYTRIQNAYDNSTNTWDAGYPSGGNYWDDYSYNDNFHGPNQDLPGHDRIGDIPYDMPCEHATDYYPVMQSYGWLNEAPENLTIDGPQQGKAGQSYSYTSSSDDPEGDPICYMFDWGDNTTCEWFGPFDSGENATASHSWTKGTFEIKVKAKDTRGLESDWSDPFPITMPRNKGITSPIFNLLHFHSNFFLLLQKLILRFGL